MAFGRAPTEAEGPCLFKRRVCTCSQLLIIDELPSAEPWRRDFVGGGGAIFAPFANRTVARPASAGPGHRPTSYETRPSCPPLLLYVVERGTRPVRFHPVPFGFFLPFSNGFDRSRLTRETPKTACPQTRYTSLSIHEYRICPAIIVHIGLLTLPTDTISFRPSHLSSVTTDPRTSARLILKLGIDLGFRQLVRRHHSLLVTSSEESCDSTRDLYLCGQ